MGTEFWEPFIGRTVRAPIGHVPSYGDVSGRETELLCELVRALEEAERDRAVVERLRDVVNGADAPSVALDTLEAVLTGETLPVSANDGRESVTLTLAQRRSWLLAALPFLAPHRQVA